MTAAWFKLIPVRIKVTQGRVGAPVSYSVPFRCTSLCGDGNYGGFMKISGNLEDVSKVCPSGIYGGN